MEDVRWQSFPSGGLLLTLAMQEFVVPASLRESPLQQMGFTSDKMRMNSKEEAFATCFLCCDQKIHQEEFKTTYF